MLTVRDGEHLEDLVLQLGQSLGLEAKPQVVMGERVYGGQRKVDVVFHDKKTGRRLGVECKYQGVSGTTYLKIPSTIDDIHDWGIKGVVVLHGPGFPDKFKDYIRRKGCVVEFEELADFLASFFNIPANRVERAKRYLPLRALGLKELPLLFPPSGPNRLVGGSGTD